MSSPSSSERRQTVQLLRSYLARCRQIVGLRRLVGVGALFAVAVGVESAGWLALARLLRQLGGESAAIAAPLAVFGALTLCRIAIQRQRDLVLMGFRLDCLNGLRNQLYAALTQAAWPVVARLRHANILSTLTSDLDRINAGTFGIIQVVVTAGVAVATVGVAVVVSPALAVPALAGGAVLSLLMLGQTRRTWRLGDRLSEAHQAFVANATEFLSALKLMKAQGGEDALLHRFEQTGRQLDGEHASFARFQANRRALLEIGGLALIGVLMLYGVTGLSLPLPTLLLALYLLSRLVPLMNQLATQSQLVTHMLPAWQSLQRLEDELSAGAFTDAVAQPSPTALERWQTIRLAGVSLRHAGSDHDALKCVDLTIPAQATVALVGPSGAGKTTLADVVLGLLPPTGGSVSVDGRPLGAVARHAWQASIAYVPQDTVLLPVSVRQNLVWDGAAHDDAAIWDALELAQAATFVRRLPQQLDTVLGEHGAGLSGGERQRLMLARAFLRRPQLLVLDEATSHLDAESEQAIRHALRRVAGSMTILLIAHRLSTVADADQIVLMDQGLIVGAGRWDQLLATQPLFRQLVAADRAGHLPESPADDAARAA